MAESVPFDRIAHRYEETRGGLERGQRFAATIDTHLEPASRILEMGVGTAAVAAPLAGLGHRVVGLDLSPAMLELGAGRLRGALILADAEILPVAAASVNAVLAVWAVHVVGDQNAMLNEVGRVVEPGGLFLVVSPTPEVESNDLMDVAFQLGPNLGRGFDRAVTYAPRLDAMGWDHVDESVTGVYEFDESPTTRADSIERRDWSSLWDLDDETWQIAVQPVVDALRSLAEPDRPRHCVHRHMLSVYRQR